MNKIKITCVLHLMLLSLSCSSLVAESYDHIKPLGNYKVVEKDGKETLLDENGKEFFSFRYDKIVDYWGDRIIVADFARDQMLRYGLTDFKGTEIVAPQYVEMTLLNWDLHTYKVAQMKEDDLLYYGVIGKDGRIWLEPIYSEVSKCQWGYIVNTSYMDRDPDKNTWGNVDLNGDILLPCSHGKLKYEYHDEQHLLFELDIKKGIWNQILTPSSNSYPHYDNMALPVEEIICVNGVEVFLEGYNISGSNYFKLRDIASVLKDTEKCFDVQWNNVYNAVSLTSQKSYRMGNESLYVPLPQIKKRVEGPEYILKDGIVHHLNSYNIEGHNFFMLRDIGKLFNFRITWSRDSNPRAIDIITTEPYLQEGGK